MNNLNESEQFDRGVVLFAFNSDKVNYIKLAELSAQLIKKHMHLPVSVITDSDIQSPHFETIKVDAPKGENFRLSIGSKKNEVWKNGDRYKVFDLSPYKTTLLLDTDYFVFDDSLSKFFDICEDYLIASNQTFVSTQSTNTMGSYGIPLLWATVLFFKKTKKTNLFFELVRRVQNNYEYYRNLYLINKSQYRNDYSFTIAHNIINGYKIENENCLPENLLIGFDVKIFDFKIKENFIVIKIEDSAYVFPKRNIHLLDKDYCASLSFENELTVYINNYV